jgi:hypothetical protein
VEHRLTNDEQLKERAKLLPGEENWEHHPDRLDEPHKPEQNARYEHWVRTGSAASHAASSQGFEFR